MKNLKAEMARYGVTENDLQTLLMCSANTIRNKISEVTDFSFQECIKIRDNFFSGCRLEYLFASDLS